MFIVNVTVIISILLFPFMFIVIISIYDYSYIKFSMDWLDKGYTPIFEWCSPGSKVVLDYGKDIMVLTGIRHMHSGMSFSHYYSYFIIIFLSHWNKTYTFGYEFLSLFFYSIILLLLF
jgi:hypothetical protein